MLTYLSPESLYARVVHRYFAFGLTGASVLLGFTIYATTQAEAIAWLVPFACVLAIGILWVGGLHLRSVLAAPEQILSQLTRLSTAHGINHDDLVPVTNAEPAAAGWNQLLEHIYSGRLSKGLEDRLTTALQTGSDDRMENVVNSLSDGVAITDASGCIQNTNPAFDALIDSSSDATGSGANIFAALSSKVHADHVPPEMVAAKVTRCRFELAQGTELTAGVLRVTCAPVMTASGESNLFIWTARDVTQAKLAEEMRTQFVETATHELRTPLTNIRAYAETLELADDIPLEQQKEFINVINSEATRLGRFVDELLNLSQMDAGGLTIVQHVTDFQRLISDAIENTRPQINSKKQTFNQQIPAKLPTLNVDKDKVAACLVNLLGNASKYTPPGGAINLVIEVSETHVTIRVEDSGYGIADDELSSVFNRFFRSDDDRVRDESGSGLGLAYTQEIVRLHGGRLTVESQLNEGSQFTMTLPL